MMKFTYRSFSLCLVFLFFSVSSAHDKPNNDEPTQHNASTQLNASTHHDASVEAHLDFKGCFSKVYAFGGADLDTGNAHFLGGLQDDKNSNRRMSNGGVMVDFLCDALSVPKIPPYKEPSCDTKNGVNFAIAGATTLSNDFFLGHNLKSLLWKNTPLNFQAQIEWFNSFLSEAGCKGNSSNGSCKADLGNSLFWIGEMGVSDFISALVSSVPLPQVSEISVRIVCELLKTLLDNGAKYIVVQGLPPVGCFPAYMSSSQQHDRDHMGCVASANIGITSYNQILQAKLEKFRKLYPHCSIVYADYWNAYLTILENPKKYQIEEPFKACYDLGLEGQFTINRRTIFKSLHASACTDPQKFISWDGIHLTEAMNAKITGLFLNEGFCKPSFSALVKTKLSV